MNDAAFQRIYKSLNQKQRQAVDAIEGPVMVVAGPGTGKTTVLTLRIANILRNTDTPPDGILALTFTESGAYSMRKALVAIIGSAAYRVRIATFHGFCNEVIKEYPDKFSDIVGALPASVVDQITIVQDILERADTPLLKPYGRPDFYVYPIIQRISELKKDAAAPEDLFRILKSEEKKLRSWGEKEVVSFAKKKEFARVYEAYEKALSKEGKYDYEDMIIQVVHRMEKDRAFRLSLSEKYLYILADEHQDANRAQNKVLELLGSFHAPSPNLFIVGDEKQAIFRFQGASLENFLYFRKLYPSAVFIELDVNYRSTQTILDAAGSMIEKGITQQEGAGAKLIASGSGKGGKIQIGAFRTEDEERAFVVSKIKDLMQKGVAPGEIAVMYRDNRDVFLISDALRRAGISFSILSDLGLLSDPEVRKMVLLMKTINEFGNDEYLARALHIDFLQMLPLDIYKASLFASKKRMSLFSVVSSRKHLHAAGVEKPKTFLGFYAKLSRWKISAQNKSISELFQEILSDSGFLEHIFSSDGNKESIGALYDLYDELKSAQEGHSEYALSDFLRYLDLLASYNILIKKKKDPTLLDSVQLMTAHRSKGLEFDHVFIIGALFGHFGGRRRRELIPRFFDFSEKENDTEDERRLFYVAMTRARLGVFITYAEHDKEEGERLPAQFIEEIDPAFKEKIKVVGSGRGKKTFRESALSSVSSKKRVLFSEKDFVREKFREQGLSVTALNNYLLCPWRYFYINLVRIPYGRSVSQMYGTAIHEALHLLFEDVRRGKTISEKKAVSYFTRALWKEGVPERVRGAYERRGALVIAGYVRAYKKSWRKNILNEFLIRGVLLSGKVRLTGKLDKVEFLPDGSCNVVDYKTGAHRSRNEIEGKTKRGNGDYKRQLVFYKLLLDLYAPEKFYMKTGEIDFVEPDPKGRFRKETFEIKNEEVSDLAKLIVHVSEEIETFSFWNTRCSDRACEFCALREAISKTMSRRAKK